MPKPRVLILRAPGTNCDLETAFAFEQAGGAPERVHVGRVLETPSLLADYQILCIPGGFSYGDDLAAGRILGSQIQHRLRGALAEFRASGKLVLGICNGFQVLIKSGLLLEGDAERGPEATLTWNDCGRFQDRWIHVRTEGDRCVFLRGIESMYLPIAHAEGKFVPRDRETLARLEAGGQLCLRYAEAPVPAALATSAGGAAGGRVGTGSTEAHEEVPFPANPNGSIAAVAGACDSTGRVFGLMPHPERHVDPTQHPAWTRSDELPEVGDGLAVFVNAVECCG
jgi:phosphoribosylformylglycinamidine synthase